MTNIDINNIPQKQAFDLISKTNLSFFIAGKAGTGKTTFLKNVIRDVKKSFLVVAPTGIAAINAGGETIHSSFGLPFGVIFPKSLKALNQNKKSLLVNVDTIIIDEVSMVRCDMIDAIDQRLRKELRNGLPFGGKQIVFIGDLFQLEPIATMADKEALTMLYGQSSPYFFNANVFKRMDLPTIEFKKIYRQSDVRFIELLENVRIGNVLDQDINLLNTRIEKMRDPLEMIITLTPRNDVAKKINDKAMSMLEGKEYIFKAQITGNFDINSFHTEEELHLRAGAQIMMTKNDSCGRWVNGTLGEIIQISQDGIKVRCENGHEYDVDRVTWDNVLSIYDTKEKKVKQEVVGSFTQYPIKTAWAITIHKSQGLTFDKVRIDLSQYAFANGQIYVALSRARSLDGLFLTRSFDRKNLKASAEIISFYQNTNKEELIDEQINLGDRIFSFIQDKKYQDAAEELFALGRVAVENRRMEQAYYLFNQALEYVTCDDCFKTDLEDLNLLEEDKNHINYFIEAVLALYSGNGTRAVKACGYYLMRMENDLNGLYLYSRSLEMMGRNKEADEILDQIADLSEYPAAKICYRGGVLNEEVLGMPGLGLLQGAIEQSPYELGAHLKLRKYARMRNIVLPLKEDKENKLIQSFNTSIGDDEFESLFRKLRYNATGEFGEYLDVLLRYPFM